MSGIFVEEFNINSTAHLVAVNNFVAMNLFNFVTIKRLRQRTCCWCILL